MHISRLPYLACTVPLFSKMSTSKKLTATGKRKKETKKRKPPKNGKKAKQQHFAWKGSSDPAVRLSAAHCGPHFLQGIKPWVFTIKDNKRQRLWQIGVAYQSNSVTQFINKAGHRKLLQLRPINSIGCMQLLPVTPGEVRRRKAGCGGRQVNDSGTLRWQLLFIAAPPNVLD